MKLTNQIAQQFRDVHFGGNWTASNLKESLSDINWQQATVRLYSLNSIAALVYHMNYYVSAVLLVLDGNPLRTGDKYSFDHPPIQSREDWDKLLDKTWADAEKFAARIEQFPESRLEDDFSGNKYGNYYRNIQGITEHIHYHLGQIVLIKKILLQTDQN
ncbi:MAG TPA: DinB family protein [Puia sp.]|jgi:hypothetical protein